jgi:cyclopropane fatty-acyl-phospholipid synthase-like methyltransferase
MKEFWNERYSAGTYAYGTAPNNFFKTAVDDNQLTGKLLLPAEGEGRNAVYAAKNGLEVHAFDISSKGKKKAMQLAEHEQVSINYHVADFREVNYEPGSFDAAALIYAHFSPDLLSAYHQQVVRLLKPGGRVVLEGFSKNNLPIRENNPEVGGPKNPDMLLSTESIKQDFSGLTILHLEETTVHLQEGDYHNGNGKVIRFIGQK